MIAHQAAGQCPLIVYEAPWNWDFLWNRAQPLAAALAAKGASVLYLESGVRGNVTLARYVHWIPHIRGRVNTLLQWPKTYSPVPGVTVVKWIGLGLSDEWFTGTNDRPSISYHMLSRIIRKTTSGNNPVWLLTSRPAAQKLLSVYRWDRCIVDMEDPWLSLSWAKSLDQNTIRDTLDRADIVFANGSLIAAEYEKFAPGRLRNLPNGIDDDFLSRMRNERLPRPDLLGNGLTVLYTGNINDRIDLMLLRILIESATKWKFVFVGPLNISKDQEAEWMRLIVNPRFKHSHPVSHNQIPALLQHADALLLPYLTHGGKTMFPAKMLEYTASGKPILAGADYTGGTISIPTLRVCDSPQAYVTALNDIGPTDASVTAACQDLVARHTWGHRAQEFLSVVKGVTTRAR